MRKSFIYPIAEALESTRWGLLDALPNVFIASKYQVRVHIWRFQSLSPFNPTRFLDAVWATAPGRPQMSWACGGDGDRGMTQVELLDARMFLRFTEEMQFYRPNSPGVPWIRYVSDHLKGDLSVVAARPGVCLKDNRTVDDMLNYTGGLGELLDETASSAVAHLSGSAKAPDADALRAATICAMFIGRACLTCTAEAVFWPTSVWSDAMHRQELFQGTPFADKYFPANVQIWYFEKPFSIALDARRPEFAWWRSSWQVSACALIPAEDKTTKVCHFVYVLENFVDVIEDIRDVLPRMLVAQAFVGEVSPSDCTYFLAGIQFMQESIPRLPHVYTNHEHKMATQKGKKLQPYSVMLLRQLEQVGPENGEDATDGSSGHKHEYHYTFVQRRHRRKLKEPRKSDGVQVIMVAAGQKFKHLPPKPEAKPKVVKVSR